MFEFTFSDQSYFFARTADEARSKWLRVMKVEARMHGLPAAKRAPRIISTKTLRASDFVGRGRNASIAGPSDIKWMGKKFYEEVKALERKRAR